MGKGLLIIKITVLIGNVTCMIMAAKAGDWFAFMAWAMVLFLLAIIDKMTDD